MKKHVLIPLTAVALVLGFTYVAHAATTRGDCVDNPGVDVTCTVVIPYPAASTVTETAPAPPPVTVTATATATVTASPTGSTSASPSATAPPTSPSPTSPTTTAPPPPSSGFPDASSTGPTTTPTRRIPQDVTSGTGWNWTGSYLSITGAGATLTGYVVNGDISVQANNVTISGNVIVSNGWPIALRHTTGVKIDHNEIRGASASARCDNGIRGIYGDDDQVTITGNNILWCDSGINHLNAGGLIRDNYIHDLGVPCSGSACAHINGIQMGAGTGALMTIRHNTIFNPQSQTDAIMLANDDGAQRNRTITNNLLGGGGYTFYGAGGPSGVATGIVVQNNVFTKRFYPNGGFWGPVAYWKTGGGNVWSGNTWLETGQPVTP